MLQGKSHCWELTQSQKHVFTKRSRYPNVLYEGAVDINDIYTSFHGTIFAYDRLSELVDHTCIFTKRSRYPNVFAYLHMIDYFW
jgi:hypothetical protein